MLNFSTFCKRKMYFRMLTNTILFQYRKLNTYFYHWWWIIRHRVWSILSSSADLSGWRNHIWWGLVCDIRHRDYIRRNRSHRGWKNSVIWTNCFGCNSHVARYLLSSLYVVCGVGCTCLSTCSLCVFYHQIGSASFARLGLVRKCNYCFFLFLFRHIWPYLIIYIRKIWVFPLWLCLASHWLTLWIFASWGLN